MNDKYVLSHCNDFLVAYLFWFLAVQRAARILFQSTHPNFRFSATWVRKHFAVFLRPSGDESAERLQQSDPGKMRNNLAFFYDFRLRTLRHNLQGNLALERLLVAPKVIWFDEAWMILLHQRCGGNWWKDGYPWGSVW